MAAVEDGEILEIDKDEVIDLCSEEPSPLPFHRLRRNGLLPRISPSSVSFRRNAYRGGDPFLAPSQPQDDVRNRSVRFTRVHRSSASFHRARSGTSPLRDIHSHLHSPIPPEEPIFERDPYATNDDAPSAIHESVPKLSQIPLHPGAFPVSSSPNEPGIPPPLTMAPSREPSWSRDAPQDVSPNTFGAPRQSRIPNPQDYDHDPDRYSPSGDQPPFSDGPVYHAEPAPPPSPYYGRQPPSIRPINTGPLRNNFDLQHRRRMQAVRRFHEGSCAMFSHDLYATSIAKECEYPEPDILSPSNAFATVDPSYQGMHSVQSPRHRVTATEDREEKNDHHAGHVQIADLDGTSRKPSSYNPRYVLSADQRHVSDILITEHLTHDEKDDKRRKMKGAPLMNSFSDEEDQYANPADTKDSRHEHHGGHSSTKDHEHGSSQPEASEEKSQRRSPSSQEQVSDGEIDSPRITSPVISVATAPEETPSPPSTKKKRAKFDAKRHLSELRKRALMSVKKRPAARKNDENVEPTSPRGNSSPAASPTLEVVAGQEGVQAAQAGPRKSVEREVQLPSSQDRPSSASDELAPGFRIHLDSTVQIVVGGVRRTMTRKQFAEWQAWPFQNRVLVEYSSDSSDSDSSDASDDGDYDGDVVANIGEVRSYARRNREREIEAMKIRMIRLGKCPSMLFGGPNSADETKNSSATGSVGKPEDKTVPPKEDMASTKNIVPSQAQREILITARQVCEGKQISTPEPECMSSPKQSDASGGEISNIDVVEAQTNSAVEERIGTKVVALSLQEEMERPSAERGSSLELFKVAEQESIKADGTAKRKSLQDDKTFCEGQNRQSKENGIEKEDPAPMKGARSAACSSASNPITELKRRIAAIERTRDMLKQQRHKKQKTVANQEVRARNRTGAGVEHKLLHQDGKEYTEPPRKGRMSKPDKTEQGRAQGDNRVRRRVSLPAKRYYSSGAANKLGGNNAILRVHGERIENMEVDEAVQEPIHDTAGTKVPANEKRDGEAAIRLPDDSAERRYIDDLKLELEQKTKELINERDRTEQLRTAELSIAEAQAKLNFTRSRVSALRDELRKAEQDVLDAEKEYQQRARVVAQLRFGNTDSSTDMVSGQEDISSRLQLTEDEDSGVPVINSEIGTESDREEDMRQEEEKMADFVLRPSPYSPSAGESFTSCLRALRAYALVTQLMSSARRDTNRRAEHQARHSELTIYLLRIPYHSRARDRIAGGILSATWGVDLDPMKAICPQELRGQCSNKACEFQHLKVFKAPKDQALQVIHVIETFFSKGDKQKEEKSIINARIAIHEGKDATKTLTSLISTLCASSKAVPYSCAADL